VVVTNNSTKTTLSGFSLVGGICTNRRKFSIIEDSGFLTTTIVAHEIGHNIGLQHDGINSKFFLAFTF
jgi:hypothetical protein